MRHLGNFLSHLKQAPFRAKQDGSRPKYHSQFGGLWIDRADANQLIEEKVRRGTITMNEADQLRLFIDQGFIILQNAISSEGIDKLNSDIDSIWRTMDPRFKVQTANGEYKDLSDVERNRVLAKLLDVYVYSEAARAVSFAQPIVAFLRLIFDEEVLAFQNLTFEVGSTQAVHQDGAYVVVDSPLKFAASWVAREDIKVGSGELIYYPRSHRFPDFVFAKSRKYWDPQQDGQESHNQFLAHLHERAKERGLELQYFRPKKGDALIWHADLAHGGGSIIDKTLTRQSYVTHYCPVSVNPHFFSFAPDKARKVPLGPGRHISSWFYNINVSDLGGRT
jgi:phytanoyl-CoA hydroxylase